MLPLENLDKKYFKEILKESKINIHKFTEEWTDENYHDPGITFLEMFSWLSEMQRYYLNKVPDSNHYKFISLYGIKLKGYSAALTYIHFSGIKGNIYLPKGIKLLAEDQVFETEKRLVLTDSSLEKIITFSNGEIKDNSYYNFNKDICFYCFGKILNKKNKLYLGFSKPFVKKNNIDLLFNLFSDYPVKLNGENIYNYGVKGKWYTFSTSKCWEELECTEDGTDSFSKTGIISLKVNCQMEKTIIDYSIEGNYYWIMFEVIDYGAHVSPKIESVMINTVKAENVNHKAIFYDLVPENRIVVMDNYLSIYGSIILQYYFNGFWIDLKENEYSLTKDYQLKELEIKFKEDYEKVRIICYDEIFKEISIIGSSNGLPNQCYNFLLENLIKDSLIIQSGKILDGKILWKDFSYERNLTSNGTLDSCFTCDLDAGEIYFGNGERGRIPFKGENNLRIISFAVSNRERGNVKKGEINKFVNELEEIQIINVSNINAASGGRNYFSIEDGKREVLKDFKKIDRAVTKQDYEFLVKQIPGIRISACKAIINNKYPNTVFIVIVPYMEADKPMPDKRLLDITKAYLEEYRLIGTKVQAICPLYIEISVKCIIVTDDINGFDKNKLKQTIEEYLSPVRKDKVNLQYKIGETIYISCLLKIINKYSKVKYVKNLWIDTKGKDVIRDKDKNLVLPENGICCCGNIEIDLTD